MDAISWLLISTGPMTDARGDAIPPGTAIAREMWDGASDWVLPDGTERIADDGRPIWQPRRRPAPVPMPVQTWLELLPADVLGSIVTAARGDGRLMMALTLLAARGMVDPADAGGLLRDLLGHAVRATAGLPAPLTPALAQSLLPA